MSSALVHASRAGVLFVARWEGLRLVPYNDVAGNATVGVGHLLHMGTVTPRDLARFRGFTTEEALHLLAHDLEVAEDTLVSEVHPPITNVHHFDALVSFVFNVGPTAFRDSTLLKLLNEGRRYLASAQFLKWNHAGNKVILGLSKRRRAERALFLTKKEK